MNVSRFDCHLRRRFSPLAALAASAWLGLAPLASAQDEPPLASAREASELSFSASARVFYGGLPSSNGSLDLNPYGPGLGVRAGLTLPVRLHLALSYEHFFGGEPLELVSVVSYRVEPELDQFTAWAGYELAFDGVTLRPCLGLGFARLARDILERDGLERTNYHFADGGLVVLPALDLAFPVGPAELMVEGRYAFLPDTISSLDALLIGVGVGAEF